MLVHLLSAACALALNAPCAQARQQLSLEPFASGLPDLTDVVTTPAEPRRLYAVDQEGRILYFVDGRRRGTFLDIRGRVLFGGERGLLGLAFHPGYKANHRFYVNYTDLRGNTRVVEFRSRNGRALKSTARQVLFVEQPFANHNGGRLEFDRAGRLYVGMGDGGSAGDPGNRAQRMSARLGKLLRINPLRRGARWQIVGLGLRNPWRFSFDRANGDLYIGDVGQGDWEEIDYRAAAEVGKLANYGWKLFEGRARYSSGNPTAGELVSPVAVYSHDDGCSVTAGYVYRGQEVPSAVGRYFYGDWCSGRIWSLRMENGNAVDVQLEPFRVRYLSAFGEDPSGELYFGTSDGKIFKLAS